MKKITIGKIQIECDDHVDIQIDGNKISVKGTPPQPWFVSYPTWTYYPSTTTVTLPATATFIS